MKRLSNLRAMELELIYMDAAKTNNLVTSLQYTDK